MWFGEQLLFIKFKIVEIEKIYFHIVLEPDDKNKAEKHIHPATTARQDKKTFWLQDCTEPF